MGEHEKAAVSGFAYGMFTYGITSVAVVLAAAIISLLTGTFVDATSALYTCIGLSLLVAIHVTTEYPNHFEDLIQTMD